MTSHLEERIARNLTKLIQVFRLMRDRHGYGAGKPLPLDPQFCALGFLLHDELPISEIGRRLQRSKPSMTAIIGKLLRQGKVRRVPDRKDRRVTLIAITDKGRAAMEERAEAIRGRMKENLAVLSDAEKRRLCRSLETVNEIAGKVSATKKVKG
jgi:DNA-binding MarR family transcriptional regulator